MKINSLRLYLLVWLLVPLAGIVAVNVYTSYRAATTTADMVTDRALLASAMDIIEEIQVSDGVLDAQIPPAAIAIFDTGHDDLVFFHVHTGDGQLLSGQPDLPLPPRLGVPDQPVFYQAPYRERRLRLVAIAHNVIGADPASPVTVIVGQTMNAHGDVVGELTRSAVGQQLVLLVVSGALVLIGFSLGLAPLMRLRDAVLDDRRDPLEPLPVESVQTELRPLVEALNQYKRRVQMQMAAQSRFIANAAHQIKTPLTLLSAQAAFAQRAADTRERQEALDALQKSVRQSAHLVNQLLTLMRSEPGARRPRAETVDLAGLARSVLEDFAKLALDRRIDLGFEPGPEPAVIVGDETMLHEMIINLVDNALRYTPPGGAVTVALSRDEEACVLTVSDTGPGIPPEERAKVFERFYRIIGTGGEGSGLGLAIVREVVAGAGGSVSLNSPPAGAGLVVTVRLPAS